LWGKEGSLSLQCEKGGGRDSCIFLTGSGGQSLEREECLRLSENGGRKKGKKRESFYPRVHRERKKKEREVLKISAVNGSIARQLVCT